MHAIPTLNYQTSQYLGPKPETIATLPVAARKFPASIPVALLNHRASPTA